MFEQFVLSFSSGLITALISFTSCAVCVVSMCSIYNCEGVPIDFYIYIYIYVLLIV